VSCIQLHASVPRSDRPASFDDDVTFSEDLVEAILNLYTKPRDVVLDPFVGFGTTVAVAERMGRVGYGIELLDDRVDYARSRVKHPERIITGDTRNIGDIALPPCDFSITSPPYMNRHNHPQNPLDGYRSLDGDYETYLRELAYIYQQMKTILKPDAIAVINAANIRSEPVTFLGWDICRVIADVMEFEREIPICWDYSHPAIIQDYCLVFANREPKKQPSKE
jgi:DNA modification methylase